MLLNHVRTLHIDFVISACLTILYGVARAVTVIYSAETGHPPLQFNCSFTVNPISGSFQNCSNQCMAEFNWVIMVFQFTQKIQIQDACPNTFHGNLHTVVQSQRLQISACLSMQNTNSSQVPGALVSMFSNANESCSFVIAVLTIIP